jgi:spore coat protein U-like protein
MKKNIVLSFLALLPLFALASRADGALNCTFGSVTGVNFGSYDVFSASPKTVTGSISYSCTGVNGNQRITIQLSTGSGTFANRTLGSGSNFKYNLYPDAANSQVWGNGTGSTYQFANNPNDTNVHTLTVYGTILAGQDVGVGSYTDTITVTMNF